MATKKKQSTKGRKTQTKNKTTKKTTPKKSSMRDEIILLLVIAVAALMFTSIYTNKAGVFGNAIDKMIFGLIGVTAYIIPFYLIFITIFKLANKKNKEAFKKFIFSILLLITGTILAQVIQREPLKIFEETIQHFDYSATYKEAGGLIGGVFADILQVLFGTIGTYIILGAFMVIFMVLLTEKSFIKLVKVISHKFYKDLHGVVKNNKAKTNKSKTAKKDNTFTIEHYQEQGKDQDKKKPLSYASQDGSNMLERVTIPTESKAEQLSFIQENEKTNVNEVKEKPMDQKEEEKEEPFNIQQENKASHYTYEFPPFDLLQKGKVNKSAMSKQAIVDNANKLQQTLENFGVKVNILNVSCGPTVTRYELQPEQGVKVSKIVSLMDDIKLNLAAADLRIEAPIPGKAAVGIEVPNKENLAVCLRDIIETDAFKKHPSSIAFAVGKDIAGKVIVADITKMPHLLIAGATGSGKSVCINTLITSIIYKAKPSDVKLIMIDPKMVELSIYNGIPHLMIPVVTDPKKASSALSWAVAEMTDRYKKFAEHNVRDLKGYNDKMEKSDEGEPLPKIVIIVDELADLMMVAANDVEDAICRLAQMARAAGIHLVIATQRPSVNVITGLIKANVPSRIAFSVSSGTDSRTIIDMNGAEKLLGKGDMLFYPVGYQKPVRVQGAFISDKEVNNIVEFVKNIEEPTYNEQVIDKITSSTNEQSGSEVERDEYFEEAVQLVVGKQKASISMLQRMFRIGFNRASRLMEQLYEAGIVGPEEGSKPRKVIITEEALNQKQNPTE